MIPISDDNRGRRLTPYVSYTIIAINILVFLYQITLPDTPADPALTEFIFRWGGIPAEISGGNDLQTLISSQFLHGGWLHIGGNMLYLWVFGDNVEDVMGHLKFLVFYLLTGIAAGLAQVLIDPNSAIPIVGASGAISGLLGAYILLFPHGKIRSLVFIGLFFTSFMIPAWIQIGLWILLQFVNGFFSLGVATEETSGGVAYFAHIGGFIAGMALVWVFLNREALDRQRAAREGTRAFQRVGR
ncbi:MAG: rhomboid family intramembrane serine protease [Chloroflexota bacterium]|nr:rhomboid family intramembrane serine protease [Chloroflexota bacterium]